MYLLYIFYPDLLYKRCLLAAGWKIAQRWSIANIECTCKIDMQRKSHRKLHWTSNIKLYCKVVRSRRLYMNSGKTRADGNYNHDYLRFDASNKRYVEPESEACIYMQASQLRYSAYTHGLFSVYSGTYYLVIFTITAINVFARYEYVHAHEFTAHVAYIETSPNALIFNPAIMIYDLINRHRFF